MNWDDFKYFITLSRTKTLKETAKLLKIDQATVGRRIYALQENLGTKLFEKKSNGFFLTAAGENILSSVEEMEIAAQSIGRKAVGQEAKLKGIIRLALPGALANHIVIPKLQGFSEKYPEIEVHFLTGPETVNLARREADIAFRFVRPIHTGLIVKKLGDVTLNLFGEKTVLQKNTLKNLDDLSRVPFVALEDNALSSPERVIRERLNSYLRPKYYSLAWSSVYYSLSAKLGLGILPNFLAQKNSELRKLDFAGTERCTLWSVVHPEVHKSNRVRAFMEFIEPALKENLK